MVFTAFCGRALWRALYRALCVHCTCTVQNTVCAILLLEAWEAHSLFVGSSCEGERVFGLGLWHVQKGICSSLRLHSHKPKKILCFFVCWVAALKMRVCLD